MNVHCGHCGQLSWCSMSYFPLAVCGRASCLLAAQAAKTAAAKTSEPNPIP